MARFEREDYADELWEVLTSQALGPENALAIPKISEAWWDTYGSPRREKMSQRTVRATLAWMVQFQKKPIASLTTGVFVATEACHLEASAAELTSRAQHCLDRARALRQCQPYRPPDSRVSTQQPDLFEI